MLQYPHIDPVLLHLGPLQVRWYGLMYVLGFIASYLLVQRQIKQYRLEPLAKHYENLNLALIVSLVLGARLGYVLFYNLDYYLQHPLEIPATWLGGMSFHGALIGLLCGGFLFCRLTKLPFLQTADVYIVTTPIGLGLGRVANFINGELYGRVSELPWAMVFPQGGPLPRHPSQLYEALLEGPILFCILWAAKKRYWRCSWPAGSLLALFLIAYGFFRILVELVREPDQQLGYLFGTFTMGQVLSCLMIFAGLLLGLSRRATQQCQPIKNNTLRSLLFLFSLTVTTMHPGHAAALEIAPRLHKTRLPNGIIVLAKETPGTRVATVQIWVKAGSIYEEKHEAGITHLIEHMIFKGTPSRSLGEVAGAIEAVGGQINAYTSYEYTVYHATLSSRHWGTALEVLSDAVLHSIFDPEELEREKKVVLEEIRMRKDRPNVNLYQELMAQAYDSHPYRLPVIGTDASVSAISRDDIVAYLKKHYHPDNFTVVVVGDLRAPQVIEAVGSLLGSLPRSDARPPTVPSEQPRKAPRLFGLTADINQTHLALAFPASAFKHPDTPILDVMTHILANGETSRLYNQLRNRKGLVYRIDGNAFTPQDPGLLEFAAILDADKVPAALEEILTEIFKMKYLPVSDEELDRAKRNLESDFVFSLERAEGQARVLGSFEFLSGDPREDKYLEQVRAVSQADIQRVANFYLNATHLTVGSIAPAAAGPLLNQSALAQLIDRAETAARQAISSSTVSTSYLPGVHQFQLQNGIRLLVREDREVPTVAIRAVLLGGLRSETASSNGAFAFISELLPKGTKKLKAQELARKVANMAGSMEAFNGKNTFGLQADFLSRFTDEALTLVRDVLLTPAFDPEEAEKIRPELLSQLKHQEDSLPSLAFKEFNRRLFAGHPYGLNTLGNESAIKGFSVDGLREIYERHTGPKTLVLSVAGDVDAEAVRNTVTQLFGKWEKKEEKSAIKESLLPSDGPTGPEIVNINRDKQQVHLVLGFLGTTLDSEDRYGLEVLDTALSGQSGRLFTELRDKESLAYSLSSFTLFGLDTGSFGIYIGTSPDKREAALKSVWQQLYRVREEMITEEELTKAKNVLISSYELGLQTHGSQAMEMALNETYKMGQDYGNRYIRAIEQVDSAKVLEMARKYIQPANYVLVTVGAEKQGEQ